MPQSLPARVWSAAPPPVRIVGAAVAGALAAAAIVRRRRALSAEGQTVLITGGARGLGFALAREFGRRGARLVLVSRTAHELAHAARVLRAEGRDVLTCVCDVRDATQVAHAVSAAVTWSGRLDVLVNNAGIILVAPAAHTPLEDYRQSLATHFWGPLYVMRAGLPHLRRSDEGRILNIASIGGRLGVPHLAAYSAGKFALVGLSDALRAELRPEGIRLTTAIPGLVRTGSHSRARLRGRHEAEAQWFGAGMLTPLSSMGAARAARQIVQACLRGDAYVTAGRQARLAEVLQVVVPEVAARVAATVTRYVLPGPSAEPSADASRLAHHVGFGWMSPWLPRDTAGQEPPPAPSR